VILIDLNEMFFEKLASEKPELLAEKIAEEIVAEFAKEAGFATSLGKAGLKAGKAPLKAKIAVKTGPTVAKAKVGAETAKAKVKDSTGKINKVVSKRDMAIGGGALAAGTTGGYLAGRQQKVAEADYTLDNNYMNGLRNRMIDSFPAINAPLSGAVTGGAVGAINSGRIGAGALTGALIAGTADAILRARLQQQLEQQEGIAARSLAKDEKVACLIDTLRR
jgi:hypothetical protein